MAVIALESTPPDKNDPTGTSAISLSRVDSSRSAKSKVRIRLTSSINPQQEFYIQLSEPERFGIARLTSKPTLRIVEILVDLPVEKDVEERPRWWNSAVGIGPGGLYKIWPRDPLPEGEYAVVEYTQDAMNMEVSDSAIQPKAAGK